MIRRGNAKKTPSAVNVAENEALSAGKGVIRNAGPDDLASVVDSCNFRLREDGSYALRKPDALLRECGVAAFPMKDGQRVVFIGDNGSMRITPDGVSANTSCGVTLKYRVAGSGAYAYSEGPVRFASVDADVWEPLDGVSIYVRSDARPIRAGDVTLLPAIIDRTMLPGIVDADLYPSESRMLPRWLSIYLDDDFGGWVSEVIVPEPNTLVDGGDGASFDPNLLLDNPYSLKDLYGYGSVGVQGIVAYQDRDADGMPNPAETCVKRSQGEFSKTVLDALFKVECKAGNVNVYTSAHMSLAPLSRCMGPNGAPTNSEELYEMDREIVCGIGQISVSYGSGEPSTPSYLSGDHTKHFSAYIPAYTTLGTFQIVDFANCVLTIRVYLYVDGTDADVYVYPGNVSADSLHAASPRKVRASFAGYTDVRIELDADGNVLSQDDGFVFGYDDRGLYIDVDDASASADMYSLSTQAFESEEAARAAALPYASGGRMYLDPAVESWTFHYYTWDLPSGSQRYSGLDGVRVKDLTERVDDLSFRMVSELSADDVRPIVLKAMMTFSKAMGLYYGVWETSEDGGVTWSACPEFVRAWRDRIVDVPTVDSTYSQETLTSSSDYVKYVKAVPIEADGGDDLATDRVDVLAISQTPRTNMFRFSVYRYEKAAAPDATVPMIVAVPSQNVPQNAHLECPKRGATYIVGTRAYMGAYTNQGIAAFFPESPALQGRPFELKYAVSEDLSKALTDADCANGSLASPLPRASDVGWMFLIREESIVANPGITHSLRVRLAVFVDGVAVPGHSLDAIYMYSNPSVVKGAESLGTPAYAASRSKYTSSTEPIVKVTSETGYLSVSSGSSRYHFEDYSPGDMSRFSGSGGSITAHYDVRFTVTNPTNAYMLTALGCSAPSRSHGHDLFPTGQNALSSSARLSVDGAASTGSFSVVSANRVTPAFRRGGSVHFKLLRPHQTVSVEYSYSLTTVDFGSAVFGSLYVADVIQALAFPVSVVSLHGETTATAKPYPAFAKSPSKYADVYYHAVRHATYYDGQAYPHPAYLADDYSEEPPSVYANGTLTKMESSVSSTALNTAYVKKGVLVSFKPYLPNLVEAETSYVVKDRIGFPKLTHGKHIYHEHRVLTYGVKGFENVLYVSDSDSYVTSLRNAIEFSYGSAVTAVMPWRDYVIVFTENATYMLIKDSSSGSGYATRTVNSQIGVPKTDGDSVQAILNGVLFKSGDKAYVYVPGRYSTVDTMLNIRRISDAVDGLLMEGVPTLSFVQDDEWHLFQRTESDGGASSVELIYNYAKNVWTKSAHAFFPDDLFKEGASWTLFVSGRSGIVSYGRDVPEIALRRDASSPSYDLAPLASIRYGDYIGGRPLLSVLDEYGDDVPGSLGEFDSGIVPMRFHLDTGQKSSRFTVSKQFLELKLSVMSLDEKDAFPMTLTVYADGMPHAHVIDANTDSPFWRDSKTLDSGAVSTTFGGASASNIGIVRQMFVKYSGRGKTLRVTMSGESHSRFAVYMMDSRYRVLPNKQ